MPKITVDLSQEDYEKLLEGYVAERGKAQPHDRFWIKEASKYPEPYVFKAKVEWPSTRMRIEHIVLKSVSERSATERSDTLNTAKNTMTPDTICGSTSQAQTRNSEVEDIRCVLCRKPVNKERGSINGRWYDCHNTCWAKHVGREQPKQCSCVNIPGVITTCDVCREEKQKRLDLFLYELKHYRTTGELPNGEKHYLCYHCKEPIQPGEESGGMFPDCHKRCHKIHAEEQKIKLCFYCSKPIKMGSQVSPKRQDAHLECELERMAAMGPNPPLPSWLFKDPPKVKGSKHPICPWCKKKVKKGFDLSGVTYQGDTAWHKDCFFEFRHHR